MKTLTGLSMLGRGRLQMNRYPHLIQPCLRGSFYANDSPRARGSFRVVVDMGVSVCCFKPGRFFSELRHRAYARVLRVLDFGFRQIRDTLKLPGAGPSLRAERDGPFLGVECVGV